ncbi:MAG: RHS repeat-associated core domain-containing protein, partial [Lachnospiraceae bacterium]|nr:RHS repeat-associated core domain-containing protein [Lachnospiraceae bacterium]
CYYYDNEIEMYYLRSRFYVPKWRRFLTPDSIDYLDYTDLNSINLYAYCGNNPVMYSDRDGHFGILAALVLGAILISASIIEGNVEYEIWKKNGYIDIQSDHVEIKNSWLIKNPIASLVFTLRLTNSKEYKEVYNEKNPSKRHWIDMWLEWEGHNIIGDASIIVGAIVAIPELLLSNPIGLLTMRNTFGRCYDVNMENSEDWWKNW